MATSESWAPAETELGPDMLDPGAPLKLHRVEWGGFAGFDIFWWLR